MGWNFWKKKAFESGAGGSKQNKFSKPKELPSCFGRYLVVNQKQDPDWVWALKCVLRPKKSKDEFDFHIFDPHQAADIGPINYDTISEHPELILYSGCYNKREESVQMNRMDHK